MKKLDTSYQLFQAAYREELGAVPEILAFHESFPDVAEDENRVFWPNDRDPGTREPYQIIEYYCTDKTCDCNRVVVAVLDRESPEKGTIVSVGFAFDRNDPEPGPYIDPLNPVTREGRSIYPFIEDMLNKDLEYVSRLKRHYKMVKDEQKKPKSRLQGRHPGL